MKTILLRTSVGIIASGLFAAAALAGPGPQEWNPPDAEAGAESGRTHETGNAAARQMRLLQDHPDLGAQRPRSRGQGCAGRTRRGLATLVCAMHRHRREPGRQSAGHHGAQRRLRSAALLQVTGVTPEPVST
jgi:hypothetical protein